MNHKILIVVDVQNDFIDGSLCNEEAIKKIPNIVKKIEEFDGDMIFVTRDTHEADYLQTNEGKMLPVVHCVKGTEGWMLNKSVSDALIKKDVGEYCTVEYINKPTFGSIELAEAVKKLEGKLDIEICGYCTDICVISNAILVKAAVYDRANIKVVEPCCAGVTPQTHFAACKTMQMCQIEVVDE